jgi:hypothetical protein
MEDHSIWAFDQEMDLDRGNSVTMPDVHLNQLFSPVASSQRHLLQGDSVQHERGYPLPQIPEAIGAAGLQELACWDDLRGTRMPGPETGRGWFVTRRA